MTELKKNKKFLIDTDVLIDYLRNQPQAAKFIENAITKSACYVSSITIAELYAGVRDGKERQLLEGFLRVFEPVPIDQQIAQQGGLFRRDFGKSHGVGLADALIAASAKSINANLLTLNKKHYPMLENIQVPYSK